MSKIKALFKSTLSKLKKLAWFTARCIWQSLKMMFLGFTVLVIAVKAPDIHNKYLREYVGDHVYMLTSSKGGGGTGFSVVAPSGKTYIVSNAHVCEGIIETNKGDRRVIAIKRNKISIRRILEISTKSDLCLIEGAEGETGLDITSKPALGDTVFAVGHPSLRPMSSSRGDIVGSENVAIFEYFMKTPNEVWNKHFKTEDGKCDGPRNVIQKKPIFNKDRKQIGEIQACLVTVNRAYMTTIVAYPGNSGSPVVDHLGRVVGVLFAINTESHWAYVVNNGDLRLFLSKR